MLRFVARILIARRHDLCGTRYWAATIRASVYRAKVDYGHRPPVEAAHVRSFKSRTLKASGKKMADHPGGMRSLGIRLKGNIAKLNISQYTLTKMRRRARGRTTRTNTRLTAIAAL